MAGKAYGGRNRPRYSIRTIWGLAKSPELSLDDEDLYGIIGRETGKDSMRKLTQGEVDKVCRVLSNMKDDVNRAERGKRTDEGGNPQTEKLRRKIYALTGELGWNNNNDRINGFVKKMFKVDRIEWLTVPQSHKLIEALKKMVDRKEEGDAGENKET
ncbi:hypothetical protein Sgly_3153 [Syntrophobotulus glycolicus DSM 8271]|uniref:Regulatory protein GemA n=1 Tax=Syntrophobotulus glycolicus (strain DSM 8271 / FlGlyR) TaxID=645991 RepID=F0SX50_SYNGF|nr:regulatory protein GemA [Syntrophobotulus glycolicus]ADY54892.1 hypothetical protein Sgly_0527 [Syntrophobotulus glycolicus DSM 8271]ADY56910.1 hypothetical protein Sgly_2631 [Syntrophobotulus glycolicus DSM 8271]ADY57247.1 hypothetical protein Sgly_2978 [Syntrophobotulus glycolicus DSM 8271]ADY57419.1 hypothetical protein Sgly_3153 [Syntrophobotulus glycolicus DSM 8271]